ncbi:hypothetical protein ACHAPQ_010500 [Fusarium lateritium]
MSNVVIGRKRPGDESVNQDTFKKRRRDEVLTHNDYTVGWVCALPKEQTAATAMLDSTHSPLSKPENDNNSYTLGSIGEHNIVIACLPKGMTGNVPAATVANSMVNTFPCIKFGLMVGIGGGVPSKKNKIRLGDVVVSTPIGAYPGVVKWDSGKVNGIDKFERTGSLNNPPKSLLTALTLLETRHDMEGSRIPQYLEELKQKSSQLASKFLRTDSLQDLLFKSSYSHVEQPASDDDEEDDEEPESCQSCDKTMTVKRQPRKSLVHYGLIASGDKLVKHAAFRNQLNKELGGHVLCVEMEAAGLVNEFPCLVIRGICDYADSHKNDDWQEYAAIVAAAFGKELLQYVQASDMEKEKPVKDVIKEVHSALTDLQSDITQIHSRQTRQEDIEILDWLTPVDYGLQQSENINTREQGTGHWLIETQEFQTWLSTQGQTLFCRGIPGVGKTILTSVVVDHLVSKFRHNSTVGIAYVYCNFRRVDEQKVDQLLASLLKQLAASLPDLPTEVRNLYTKHQQRRTHPSLQETLSALKLVAARFSRVFIIIDALDETGSSREDFLIELGRLQQQHDMNLFITSRHDTKITNEKEALFKNLTTLEITAALDDLKTYVRGSLKWLPSSIRNGTTLPQDIVKGIAKSVDGIFLLAQIYLNLLSFKISVTEIRDQLETFQQYGKYRGIGKDVTPLVNAYKQTMERINGQQPEHATLAKKVLLWIAFARRELQVVELQHALATSHEPKVVHDQDLPFVEKMVAVCAGLVTIDEKTNVIRLVHFTTQEYIDQQPGELLPMTEQCITRTCVRYLSFSNFKDFETFRGDYHEMKEGFLKQLESYPFYDYAANNWGHHARDSPISRQELERVVVEGELLTSLSLLFVRGSFMDHCTFFDGLFDEILGGLFDDLLDGPFHSHSVTKLHMAVYFGLTDLVEDLLRTGLEIDCEDRHGRTPLSYAAELGWEKTVSLLVKEGGEIDSQAIGPYLDAGRTPLTYAAHAGHEGITRILLNNGASVTLVGGDEFYDEFREEFDEIFGERFDGRRTPLFYAVRSRHVGVARLLLDKYIQFDSQDQDQDLRESCDGSAALLIAAELGHERMVRLLLDTRRVSVDSLNRCGSTPLLHAVYRGDMAIILLLLSRGADINGGQNPRNTPILAAAQTNNPGVVQVLLHKEANPDGGVSTGRYKCVEKTLRMTPERNRLAEEESFYLRTPLSYMSEFGHESVVRLLLEKGANANFAVTERLYPEITGRTPLSYAAEQGHEEVARLLLERDEVDPDSDDYKGRTPLSYAVKNGNTAIVRLLLEKEAVDVHKRGQYNHENQELTILEYAQMCGHEEIVQMLIENGASQWENE